MASETTGAAFQTPRSGSPWPEGDTFVLPGGYVVDSAAHREVELGPVTGADEEYVTSTAVPAAVLITKLLGSCVRRIGTIRKPGVAVVRELLVGDREFLILRLRQLTYGDKVDLQLACPRPECGKTMDVSFSLREIPIEERPVDRRQFAWRAPDGTDFLFRLPTGCDQEALAAAPKNLCNEDHLLARLIQRIGNLENPRVEVISALPGDVRAQIEERIGQLGPALNVDFETICPECQIPFASPLDLPTLLLAELMPASGALEREVHFLALHYHWSEWEILRMTRTKRRRYLDLLCEELGRGQEM
jgi:hypothetical protein